MGTITFKTGSDINLGALDRFVGVNSKSVARLVPRRATHYHHFRRPPDPCKARLRRRGQGSGVSGRRN